MQKTVMRKTVMQKTVMQSILRIRQRRSISRAQVNQSIEWYRKRDASLRSA